ncbi:hypothetical protein HC02_16295 [Vibrio parahaemolyticus]|nr:hypothetical protein HC02_16295 [Vibrio parahaemolyticus]
MILEGVVSNVANFGAFVDIGVHQDGLVHISALTDRFVSDPREVVKAGDIVKVKVMEVDVQRKRIGLSMRLNDEPGQDNRSNAHQQRRVVMTNHNVVNLAVMIPHRTMHGWRICGGFRQSKEVV